MAAPRTSVAFVEWLASRHPAVGELLDEHLSDYDELLPHVFFGDVARYAAEVARAGDVSAGSLDSLLLDLDAALAADRNDEVGNLIWGSFVENAQGVPGDAEEPLRRRLRDFRHLADVLGHYE
jgi:hypothetical protein